MIPLVSCFLFFFFFLFGTDDESENFELPDDDDPAVKSNHSEDVGDGYLFPPSPTTGELDPACVVCHLEEEARKDKKKENKKLKKEGKRSKKTTKGQIKVGSNYAGTVDKFL